MQCSNTAWTKKITRARKSIFPSKNQQQPYGAILTNRRRGGGVRVYLFMYTGAWKRRVVTFVGRHRLRNQKRGNWVKSLRQIRSSISRTILDRRLIATRRTRQTGNIFFFFLLSTGTAEFRRRVNANGCNIIINRLCFDKINITR